MGQGCSKTCCAIVDDRGSSQKSVEWFPDLVMHDLMHDSIRATEAIRARCCGHHHQAAADEGHWKLGQNHLLFQKNSPTSSPTTTSCSKSLRRTGHRKISESYEQELKGQQKQQHLKSFSDVATTATANNNSSSSSSSNGLFESEDTFLRAIRSRCPTKLLVRRRPLLSAKNGGGLDNDDPDFSTTDHDNGGDVIVLENGDYDPCREYFQTTKKQNGIQSSEENNGHFNDNDNNSSNASSNASSDDDDDDESIHHRSSNTQSMGVKYNKQGGSSNNNTKKNKKPNPLIHIYAMRYPLPEKEDGTEDESSTEGSRGDGSEQNPSQNQQETQEIGGDDDETTTNNIPPPTLPLVNTVSNRAGTDPASNSHTATPNHQTTPPIGQQIFGPAQMASLPKREVLEWVTVSAEHKIYVVDVGMTLSQCDAIVVTSEQACKGQYAAYTYAKQTLGCREHPLLAKAAFGPVHAMVHGILHKLVPAGDDDNNNNNNNNTKDGTTPDNGENDDDDGNDGGVAVSISEKNDATADTTTNNNTKNNNKGGGGDDDLSEKRDSKTTIALQKPPMVLQLDDREPHIVKYDVTKKERQKLDMHTDKSEWTFLIALSNGCGVDYEGGGTYFECLEATVHIQKGHALVFPGKLKHCGIKIRSGIRFLLVGFMVDKPTPTPTAMATRTKATTTTSRS